MRESSKESFEEYQENVRWDLREEFAGCKFVGSEIRRQVHWAWKSRASIDWPKYTNSEKFHVAPHRIVSLGESNILWKILLNRLKTELVQMSWKSIFSMKIWNFENEILFFSNTVLVTGYLTSDLKICNQRVKNNENGMGVKKSVNFAWWALIIKKVLNNALNKFLE